MSRDQIRSIQQALIDSGFLDRTFESKFGTRNSADGYWGKRSQEALDAWKAQNEEKDFSQLGTGFMYNDARSYVPQQETKQQTVQPEQKRFLSTIASYNPYPKATPGLPTIVGEAIRRSQKQNTTEQPEVEPMSFEEYMYRSGSDGIFRKVGNVVSVVGNMINGLINPHGNNAWLSEGGRRQLVGAAGTGSSSVTDTDHKFYDAMKGHSGQEFREQTGIRGLISQAANAPYHNVFGQTAITTNDGGQSYSVSANEANPDAYTFNNVWRGNKVIEVKDDGSGTGSFWDALHELWDAKRSGASLKSAIESASSIRGTDVQPDRRSTVISNADMKKYWDEYNRYLNSSPEEMARINQRMKGNSD